MISYLHITYIKLAALRLFQISATVSIYIYFQIYFQTAHLLIYHLYACIRTLSFSFIWNLKGAACMLYHIILILN